MLSKAEYILQGFNKPFIHENVQHLLTNLCENRIIFTKFGDGEGRCMMYHEGANCDNDQHTKQLADALRQSFVTLCDMATTENVYVGKWHSDQHTFINLYLEILYDYCIAKNNPLISPPFVDYHFCYPDNHFHENQNMYDFVKTLQTINKFKIVVSNSSNTNLSHIFKGNVYIEIPSNSWFANGEYDTLYNSIAEYLDQFPDGILLIAGGLASKVLIKNLALNYSKASFIDIGSGFDILCKNVYTRSWNEFENVPNSFENQCKYFADLLPVDYVTAYKDLQNIKTDT